MVPDFRVGVFFVFCLGLFGLIGLTDRVFSRLRNFLNFGILQAILITLRYLDWRLERVERGMNFLILVCTAGLSCISERVLPKGEPHLQVDSSGDACYRSKKSDVSSRDSDRCYCLRVALSRFFKACELF